MSSARRTLVFFATLAIGPSLALARPHPLVHISHAVDAPPPLRIVLEEKRTGARWANCLFSTRELAERAPPGTPTRDSFEAGEAIWGRCYLPDALGAYIDAQMTEGVRHMKAALER